MAPLKRSKRKYFDFAHTHTSILPLQASLPPVADASSADRFCTWTIAGALKKFLVYLPAEKSHREILTVNGANSWEFFWNPSCFEGVLDSGPESILFRGRF